MYVGTMIVNGKEYTGEAPGPYVGLDLVDHMFVGAIPDFTMLPASAGYRRGFVGELKRSVLPQYEFSYLIRKKNFFSVKFSLPN